MYVDYKLIGERIKKYRKTENYTQEQLAECLDVSVGYVSQMERGITKINLDTLAHIADVLHHDISVFIHASNFGNPEYLKNDFYGLYHQLNQSERIMLYQLLKTYLKNK